MSGYYSCSDRHFQARSNRHERRRAKMQARSDHYYTTHIARLPQVPLGPLPERGRVYHLVTQHDDWCSYFTGAECNCNPIITRHVEPVVVPGTVLAATATVVVA